MRQTGMAKHDLLLLMIPLVYDYTIDAGLLGEILLYAASSDA